MIHLISVTEAVRSFADIIGRVYYRGEEFNIKKGNMVVAHIGPAKNRSTLTVAELNQFLSSAPALSDDDLKEFEKDLNEIRSSVGEVKDKWD